MPTLTTSALLRLSPQSPPSGPLCSSAAVLRHQRGSGVTSKAGDAAVIRALTSSVPQNPARVPFSTSDSTRRDPGTFKGQLVPQPKLTVPHTRCSWSRPLQCRVPDLNELRTISRGDSATLSFNFFVVAANEQDKTVLTKMNHD